MHSFLIVGTDKYFLNLEVDGILNKFGAKRYDFTASKIDDVRSLINFAGLTKSEPIGLVLDNFDLISIEASNALLKTLEEGQKNTFFILCTTNEHAVPETIRSRCKIIYTKNNPLAASHKSTMKFIHGDLSSKLKHLTGLTKREDAETFLLSVINAADRLLLDKIISRKQGYFLLLATHKTYKSLKANGNVTIQLTRFLAMLA